MAGIDPEGARLPIKLDSTSNGEFAPVPLWPANLEANRLAHEAAAVNSKRLGCSKRTFLTSAFGAASTLLAFNAANAAAGRTGGFFELPREAALDLQLTRVACSSPSMAGAPSLARSQLFASTARNIARVKTFVRRAFTDNEAVPRHLLLGAAAADHLRGRGRWVDRDGEGDERSAMDSILTASVLRYEGCAAQL